MTQRPSAAVAAAQVSVVICCYTTERWDDTLAAVGSVLTQEPPPGEVVVVVDHNPELEQRLRAALPVTVTIVDNHERRGLAGARNCGVAAASGDVVAFLDDDAVAEPGWLARLTAAYDEGALGAGGGVEPRWDDDRPAWFPPEFDWVVGCSYTGLPTEVGTVRNFIGANMSLRRAALVDVGGFSHSLGRVGKHPAGCEETELCIRAGRAHAGSRFVYDPQALVRHRVTPERATWRYFRKRCYAEGISKAVVSRLAGSDAALATERAYVARVLPSGVRRGVIDTLRGDVHGLRRSLAIVAGALITAAGYARGRWA